MADPRPRFPAAARRHVLAVAALAACLLGAASTAPTSADEWGERGTWQTVASPDDVRALALDDAALWAATEGGGVARWSADGASLRQYLAPQDGLPCNDVRDVVRWRGRWYFATCDGLAFYDRGSDRMVAAGDGLPGRSITALVVDAQDRLWAGAEPHWDPTFTPEGATRPGGWRGGGAAYTADGSAWRTTGLEDDLPSTNVRDLAVYQGAVWVATEPYQQWQKPGTDPEGSPVGGHYESTGGGAGRFDGFQWQIFDSVANPILSDNVRVLASGSDALWLGSGGRGLLVYSSGRWASMTDCGDARRCIQDDFVSSLAVAGDGSVWVGTSRFNGRGTGLAVVDSRGTPLVPEDDTWRVYGAFDGLPGELAHAVLPDPRDASVWAGVAQMDTEGRVHGRGLVHLGSNRQTVSVLSASSVGGGTVVSNDVTALVRSEDGSLWVGTARSGLSLRRPNGTWQTFTHASTGGRLGSDAIADLAVEPSGSLWVATRETTFDSRTNQWTDGGLSRYDGSTWSVLRGTGLGLPGNHLSALALDGRGKLWVGSGATDRGSKEHAYRGWGLAVIDLASGRWERTFTFPTITSNNVTDIAVSGKHLWVSTAYFFYVDTRPGGAQVSTGGGLSVYDLDAGQWRKITHQQGLTPAVYARGQAQPLLDLRSIQIDEATGEAWAGGLAYPSAAYQEDVVPDGVVERVTATGVTTQRLPGAGPVVALARDPAGFVWAGTASGGVHVWVGDRWVHRPSTRGGLPSNDVSALSFAGGEVWLGTAGHGLVHLVDAVAPTAPPSPPTSTPASPGTPATPGPTAPPLATPTSGSVITHLPYEIYLPNVVRHDPPAPTPTAEPPAGTAEEPTPTAEATRVP